MAKAITKVWTSERSAAELAQRQALHRQVHGPINLERALSRIKNPS